MKPSEFTPLTALVCTPTAHVQFVSPLLLLFLPIPSATRAGEPGELHRNDRRSAARTAIPRTRSPYLHISGGSKGVIAAAHLFLLLFMNSTGTGAQTRLSRLSLRTFAAGNHIPDSVCLAFLGPRLHATNVFAHGRFHASALRHRRWWTAAPRHASLLPFRLGGLSRHVARLARDLDITRDERMTQPPVPVPNWKKCANLHERQCRSGRGQCVMSRMWKKKRLTSG